MDIQAASDEIGADLGLGISEPADTPDDVVLDTPDTPDVPDTPDAPDTPEPDAPAPVVRAAPKSWAKETHEVWGGLPDAAKDQIELREKQFLDGLGQYKEHADIGRQFREVSQPFESMLREHGVTAPEAFQRLMGAQYRLTNGPMEQRQAAYQELGRNLGLIQDPNAPQVDPTVKALQEQVGQLTTAVTEKQRRELADTKARVAKEVETFAADKDKHPYFDEVAEDIAILIGGGLELNDAYERAVWANPVTRAKELNRVQTDTEKKLRENARLDALKASKAKGSNVKTRDTNRAPTEPLGSWEDTMKATLTDIKSRAH